MCSSSHFNLVLHCSIDLQTRLSSAMLEAQKTVVIMNTEVSTTGEILVLHTIHPH